MANKNVVNIESLMKKLDKLGGNSQEAIQKGVIEGTKVMQGFAKELCPVGGVSDDPLRESIKTRHETDGGGIKGIVFTNADHAPYVEFGTGPVGEAMGGVAPEIKSKISYKEDGWYIPADEIEEAVAQKYNFKKVKIKGKEFYYSEGQAAQPFLYPALATKKKVIKARIAGVIKKEIRKLCR